VTVAIVAADPDRPWAAARAASVSVLTSGASPFITSTVWSSWSACSAVSFSTAARSAPAVPFISGWIAVSTSSPANSSRRPSGESTSTIRSAPAARAAAIGHAMIGRPHSGCNSFWTPERMRVPWPAARMTTTGPATHRS